VCDPACENAAVRAPALPNLSSSYPLLSIHPAPSALIAYLYPDLSIMGTLKVAIGALDTVSIIFGMVPLIGENLKSAAELASKICEQVQVRRYHQLLFEEL
jgi:hypothetical protein